MKCCVEKFSQKRLTNEYSVLIGWSQLPECLSGRVRGRVLSIMFDFSHMTVPPNISDLFTKAKEKHMHKTRFSSLITFTSQPQDWVKLKGLLPDLELNFGTPSTTNFVNSPRMLLKNKFKVCCFWYWGLRMIMLKRLFYCGKLQSMYNCMINFTIFSYPSFLSSSNFVFPNSSNSWIQIPKSCQLMYKVI